MKRVDSKLGFISFLLSLTALIGCDTAPTQTSVGRSNLEVQELSSRPADEESETIRLNNCGGKASASQIAERSGTVQVEGGGQVSASIGVITAAVNGQYSSGASRVKSITLTAPPDTSMVFTLRWSLEEHTGRVTENNTNATANYRYLVPLSVEIIEQRDQGCGYSPEAPAPKPTEGSELAPLPPTPTQKIVEFTPTATQPTAIPETPSGTILEAGEVWRQSGWELKMLSDGPIEGSDSFQFVALHFELYNSQPHDRGIKYALDSFSATDNLGNNLKANFIRPRWWSYEDCGQVQSIVSANDNITIGVQRIGTCVGDNSRIGFPMDFADPTRTEIIVSVDGISSITNARWRIPIYH